MNGELTSIYNAVVMNDNQHSATHFNAISKVNSNTPQRNNSIISQLACFGVSVLGSFFFFFLGGGGGGGNERLELELLLIDKGRLMNN